MCYGREFCGRPDRHPYEPFLQLEGIEHRKTRVKRPQSNGIVERFHRTLQAGRGMNGRTPLRAFLDRIRASDNSKEDTDRQTDQATAA